MVAARCSGAGDSTWLWDLETGEEIERLDGQKGVWSLAFAPDGRRAVTTAIDKTVRVWGLPPGRAPGEQPAMVEVAHFLGHEGAVGATVAVSHDGRRILTGSDDESLILWDRETARSIRRFTGHEGAVRAVAFSPDGLHAISGGDDKVIRLWDLESGETIGQFRGHADPIWSVAFSPDGRLAYSAGGRYPNDGQRPQDWSDSPLRIWDVKTSRELRKLDGHKGTVWIALSPDGRRVLSGGHDMSLILWDGATGKKSRRYRGQQSAVTCVAFLPDGRRAVSCGWDGSIRLWDVESGQEIPRFPRNFGATWVAVSPDGRRLLSSNFIGRDLRLWDVESGSLIQRINYGNVNPNRGSFTPDGQYALWGGMDGVVRMYRLNGPAQADRPASPAGPATTKPSEPGKSR